MVQLPDPTEQPTMRAEEVAEAFDVSIRTLYTLVAKGDAPVMPLRLGRRMVWPTAKVRESLGL